MFRILLASTFLAAACIDGDGASREPLDPATCPAAPFEMCGVRDGGWDVFCEGGVIYERSYNGVLYCAPDSSEVVCDDIDSTPRATRTCASGTCNADPALRTKYLETHAEYSAFDLETLCQ